jgi:hypothetical protein
MGGMKPQAVSIPVNDQVLLEGAFTPGSAGGVLVLHPHPLYGGDMHNNVVEALATAGRQSEAAALQINFRGVGGSTGSYAEGLGEVEDVVAAWQWLAERVEGPKVLMGYSFGAMVGALSLPRLEGLVGAVWVSPAYTIGPLPAWPLKKASLLVVAGDNDQFGNLEWLEGYMAELGALGSLIVFPGADHFWLGRESALISKVIPFLSKLL